MATHETVPPDGTDAYDYTGGEVDRPDLVADLDPLVEGDVRFDDYSRQLYATDASAYEQLPIGVVLPRSTEDVAAVVGYCFEHEIPVLPRGGGTSLAGQTVNEAVVLDFSRYMDDARIDPETATATAEAGITLGKLNETASDVGLTFGPDPAWGDKSVLGGAIGNNSTGSHSLVYGKTDYYVEEVEAVLADGTIATFGEIPVQTLREEADPTSDDIRERVYAAVVEILDEERAEIDRRYPSLKRNVSGYNLDALVEDARGTRPLADGTGTDPDSESGTVNLARLLAGSEGTLAVITEATVALEPEPETKAVALLTYDSLIDAMEDVAPILEHDPCAVEVMDDVLLDLAAEAPEFEAVVGLLPEETHSVLLVEFYADSDENGRQQVADLVADRVGDAATETDAREERVTTSTRRCATHAMEAHDAERRATFWKMRKAGMPILLSRTSDAKHLSFIEDCAIPAEHLPAYVEGFQEILDDHDTFASVYAHAGPGVLHVRPLVDTKTVEGVDQLEGIADDVTDLVVEYGGSVSGEHGDGRARTQWNRKLYGERLWTVFRELKTAFDPKWLLNPGTVCGTMPDETADDTAAVHDMTEHLRFSPSDEFDAGFDPALEWANENGLRGMVELCHGCGGCRGPQSTTGGVMCPTYRVAEEEIQSTRGRANLLRSAMNGSLDEAELLGSEFGAEVMDLCVGCKGCEMDCPSGVDMAKLKAEVTHASHERRGASLRDRLFANIDSLSRLGSLFAPLSNLGPKLPGVRRLMETTLGIDRERELPTFERESFADWFASRGSTIPARDADRTAVLFPDTYTNYSHPEVGKASVRVLEAAGVRVELADARDSGRPAYSKGFIHTARAELVENARALAPELDDRTDVVLVEPSDAVMFQSDALDVVPSDHPDHAAVESLADNSYGLCEYLDSFRLDERLDGAGEGSFAYHGHCHQTAKAKDHHAVGVLRRAGYDVSPIDSTCCGMAGSFGYETEHYSMSRAIGEQLAEQVTAAASDRVITPGASCRSQLESFNEQPVHPAVALDDTLPE